MLSTSASTCKTFGSTGSCNRGGRGAYSRHGCTGLTTSSSDHSRHIATARRQVAPSFHGFADPDLKVKCFSSGHEIALFGMHPMRVVLQSMFCGTKMSALGAGVSGPRCVFCFNVIVQVGGLGDQLAHCALPLPAPQSNHHGPDGIFDICDVRLLSEGTNQPC